MGNLLSYSIIGGLCMLAMYLAYRLFLARDNQHGFNRAVLLAIYFVAFALCPALTDISFLKAGSTTQTLLPEGIGAVGTADIPASGPVWGTVLIWIYMAGMIIVAIKTVVTWIRLVGIIRSGKKIKSDGYTLVLTETDCFAPFSWMRYVVISAADYENSCQAITAHELKHVACRHWIDLLIAQMVCIINWFNPSAWLMRDELMLVHEYQADMAVIDSGFDVQEYQILLIKKAVGSRFPSLANSLNHSKLKKRITMMYQEKSSGGRRFKALALVPMLALALGVAGVPAVRAAVSTISSSEVSVDKGSENKPNDKTVILRFKVTDINNDGNRTTVTLRGTGLGNSVTVSGGTFSNNGKTYTAKSLNCNMTDGNAVITATFPFSSKFVHPSMTLMVNGNEIPFDLENYFAKANAGATDGNDNADAKVQTSIKINGNSSSSFPENLTVYVDGEEIPYEKMNDLSPDKIESITVDKQSSKILITLKR